jgi:hypothetical protein
MAWMHRLYESDRLCSQSPCDCSEYIPSLTQRHVGHYIETSIAEILGPPVDVQQAGI